jgi:uncharacterized protein (TIGR03437 family)
MCGLVAAMLVAAAGAAAQNVDPSTLDGKVLFGYQGWFRCPGGGTMGTNWSHWANGVPSAASLVIDMYPDLREFEPGETCAVPGMTIGSNPASLFSSGNSPTVARHFRWMQQYGLDGVLVQRFVTDIPGSRASGDAVLRNVMDAARRYGRVFAIEYDISGAAPSTVLATLQDDWRYLVDTLQVAAHPGYLRHQGKPVVGVWGIGLNDDRHPPSDPDAALRLIEWFQSEARVAYLGGTPAYWRTRSNDAYPDARWTAVYQAMDGIQPWTVGRYGTVPEADRWRTDRLQPDLAATSARGQFYMPVIFPGFSWYNLNRTARQNQIPRGGGAFLWRQAWNARAAGARMLKIAMFDEVNESTAMFKLAARRQDAPDQGYWLTLDADGFLLPSDWYLRLAGEIARAFRGQGELVAAMPASPGPPWPGAGGRMALAAVNAASFADGRLAPEAIAAVFGTGLDGASVAVIDSSGVGREADVLYAAPGQLNLVMPAGTAIGAAALVLTGADGTVRYGSAAIAAVAPGIFGVAAGGEWLAAALVRVVRPDGTESSAPVAVCADAGICHAVPVDLGPPGSTATLELYGTGMRGRSSLSAVACTIGGVDAPVLAAGPHRASRGVDLVMVSLPRSLAGSGPVSVRLSLDGVAANTTLVSFR